MNYMEHLYAKRNKTRLKRNQPAATREFEMRNKNDVLPPRLVEALEEAEQILGIDNSNSIDIASAVMPSGDTDLKSAMSSTALASIESLSHWSRQQPRDSDFHNATVAAAAQEWLRSAACAMSTRLRPRFNEAEFSKLGAALGVGSAVQKAALAEDSDATGGFLVPTIVAGEVVRLVADSSKVTPLCRPWPMTKKVEQVPNEATAVTINWIDEANTLTGGEPVFGQTTLTAEKLAGRATLSIEVFEDSNVALLPYLLSVFSEKMAGELDFQMILGDGSQPQITGVMNASGINAITSGTAAGRALTYALLVSTFTAASEGSAREGSYWFVSPAGYTQLLSLVDSQGRPIVQMDVQGAPAGAILGKPIIESARLGGTLTLDDTTETATKIVFGPPRTILFGTRTGMRWDVTDQVNWASYQMDARLIGRFAGNVGVPAAWTYLGEIAY